MSLNLKLFTFVVWTQKHNGLIYIRRVTQTFGFSPEMHLILNDTLCCMTNENRWIFDGKRRPPKIERLYTCALYCFQTSFCFIIMCINLYLGSWIAGLVLTETRKNRKPKKNENKKSHITFIETYWDKKIVIWIKGEILSR